MTDEKTPAEGQQVLRQAPLLNERIDGEATPVALEPDRTLSEEHTPVVPSGREHGRADEATDPMIQQSDMEPPQHPVALPRTGLEEFDAALTDLESALERLSTQDRRLLVVVALCFVSLFMPWFQVQNHGALLPASPVSGVELAGLSSTVLIVSLVSIMLAHSIAGAFVRTYRRAIVRGLTTALALRFGLALVVAPAGQIPWSYSLWVVVPAILCFALVLGLLGRLPRFPRRPLSPT